MHLFRAAASDDATQAAASALVSSSPVRSAREDSAREDRRYHDDAVLVHHSSARCELRGQRCRIVVHQREKEAAPVAIKKKSLLRDFLSQF